MSTPTAAAESERCSAAACRLVAAGLAFAGALVAFLFVMVVYSLGSRLDLVEHLDAGELRLRQRRAEVGLPPNFDAEIVDLALAGVGELHAEVGRGPHHLPAVLRIDRVAA